MQTNIGANFHVQEDRDNHIQQRISSNKEAELISEQLIKSI